MYQYSINIPTQPTLTETRKRSVWKSPPPVSLQTLKEVRKPMSEATIFGGRAAGGHRRNRMSGAELCRVQKRLKAEAVERVRWVVMSHDERLQRSHLSPCWVACQAREEGGAKLSQLVHRAQSTSVHESIYPSFLPSIHPSPPSLHCCRCINLPLFSPLLFPSENTLSWLVVGIEVEL